jgi:selenide,water dikinase
MNIVCFPAKTASPDVLLAILRGGLEKIREAGAVLVGGHSLDDVEIKYGLSVTGLAHPEKIVTNALARPGQGLVLTKPLGSGILSTALKARRLPAELERRLIEVMAGLNDQAAAAMVGAGVRAATDITGFGLLGHGLELARGSGVELIIQAGRVPLLEGVLDFARMGLIPGGSQANARFCAREVVVEPGVEPIMVNVLADAQTSGGLLMAVDPEKEGGLLADLAGRGVDAAVIGRVGEKGPGRIVVQA